METWIRISTLRMTRKPFDDKVCGRNSSLNKRRQVITELRPWHQARRGPLTCNDFLLEAPWHENVWVPLLYILMVAEVSQHGIYVHVTLSKRSYDTAPIMNPDKMTPVNILHFQSKWHDLFTTILHSCDTPLPASSCTAFSLTLFFYS